MNSPEKQEVSVLENSAPLTFMEMIAQNVNNPNFDAGKLNALIDANERVKKIQAEIDFNAAMLELQSKLPVIKKNGEIDYGKGAKPIKFAKIEDIEKEIRKIYLPLGFFLRFDEKDGEHIGILTHRAGHKETSHVKVPADTGGGKNAIQGIVSSGSYAQRVLLKRLLNLVFEGDDDDGTGGTIDDSQAEFIKTLIKESGADTVGFLKYMRAENVESIAFKDYRKAVSSLQEKKKKAEKKDG